MILVLVLIPAVIKLIDGLASWVRAKGQAEVIRAKQETKQLKSGHSVEKRSRGREHE
ncbi:hypothetical protein [Streptomyces virginiae]|uniref:hypothetical protein n=1 Tax=Streptomyces virginiae TaxID=1961 RepID=UPI00343D0CFA